MVTFFFSNLAMLRGHVSSWESLQIKYMDKQLTQLNKIMLSLIKTLPDLHLGWVCQAVQHQHDVGQKNPENQPSYLGAALISFDARHH